MSSSEPMLISVPEIVVDCSHGRRLFAIESTPIQACARLSEISHVQTICEYPEVFVMLKRSTCRGHELTPDIMGP